MPFETVPDVPLSDAVEARRVSEGEVDEEAAGTDRDPPKNGWGGSRHPASAAPYQSVAQQLRQEALHADPLESDEPLAQTSGASNSE